MEILENVMVTAVHKDRYELLAGERKLYGRLKSANYYQDMAHRQQDGSDKTGIQPVFPTVGDRVKLQYNPSGDSLILSTGPRRSVFLRKNPSPGMPDQAVAANFDFVFIVMSCNRDFNLTKLERYLSVSWQSGGTPVIILSKADLCEDVSEYLAKAMRIAPGVETAALSAVTGEGMEQLKKYLIKGKSAALLGSSGVGKSSLINALLGEEVMKTSSVREADSQGRHTTTYRQSFLLPTGAMIIDTPGMRVLGVSTAEDGMDRVFEDIEELISQCRFCNCSHGKEKGCAVQKALADGRLSTKRWDTYLRMKREEEHSRERAEYLQRKQMKHTKYKLNTQRRSKYGKYEE